MRPGTSLVSLMYWIGLTSPEAVTVCRNSCLTSILTVVTSGSSLRLAKTLTMITSAKTATATTAIIFFFRLNAISCSFDQVVNFLIGNQVLILHKLRQSQARPFE